MTPHTPNSTMRLPRRIQRPLRPPPAYDRHRAGPARLQQSGRHRLRRLSDGRLRCRPRIAARRRSAPDGVSSQTNELPGAFELAVFLAPGFGFQTKRAARGRGEAAADLRAERAADEAAERGPRQRKRLSGNAFQDAADRLADRRAHDAADGTSRLSDQVAEKLIELLLVIDLHELSGQLHLVGFIEYAAFAHPFGLLGLVVFRSPGRIRVGCDRCRAWCPPQLHKVE